MAMPAYMKIETIPGGCRIEKREGYIEVLEFNHQVRLPTDPDTGGLTGTRKHEPVVFVKEFDKASPLLYKAVCNGSTIPKVTITWFQVNEEGSEKPYFTHTFEKVRICSVQAIMRNVKDPGNDRYVHMEEVSLRYEKVTWLFIEGTIQHDDSWFEKRE